MTTICRHSSRDVGLLDREVFFERVGVQPGGRLGVFFHTFLQKPPGPEKLVGVLNDSGAENVGRVDCVSFGGVEGAWFLGHLLHPVEGPVFKLVDVQLGPKMGKVRMAHSRVVDRRVHCVLPLQGKLKPPDDTPIAYVFADAFVQLHRRRRNGS